MKKIALKFSTIGALVFALFALLAPQRAEAWMWSFIKGQDWKEITTNAKWVDAKIKKGEFYPCDNILFAYAPGQPGNPTEYGALQFKSKDGKLTRRYLDNSKPEAFTLAGKGIVTPGDKLGTLTGVYNCYFVVWRDIDWYKPDAKMRFFHVAGIGGTGGFTGKIEFGQDKPGFTLVEGKIEEDKNFKAVAGAEQMMEFYSSVPGDAIKNIIELNRKAYKILDTETFASKVYVDWIKFGTSFGALQGLAPIWALPLEFAGGFQDNLQKAYMAYAIACALKKEPSSDNDFKNDLYILLDDNTLEKTIGVVATAAGWTGNAAELITAGKIVEKIGKSKFAQAVSKAQTAKITAKFTVKGASKVAAAIASAAPVVSAIMGATQAATFGKKALEYYKAK